MDEHGVHLMLPRHLHLTAWQASLSSSTARYWASSHQAMMRSTIVLLTAKALRRAICLLLECHAGMNAARASDCNTTLSGLVVTFVSVTSPQNTPGSSLLLFSSDLTLSYVQGSASMGERA